MAVRRDCFPFLLAFEELTLLCHLSLSSGFGASSLLARVFGLNFGATILSPNFIVCLSTMYYIQMSFPLVNDIQIACGCDTVCRC